ncbi:hypothetical protein K439DRAFT_1336018 [Ramaria rubella]|nr:hypothetical protein K439DRAFT_1336018 [Ramaria rubella]
MDRASSSFKHRKPLDPPPPSFSRPVPPHLHPGAPGNYPGGPLAPFPPLHLYSKEKSLDGGFPILLPPCAFQPHPFSQRDIMEGDWARFLEDLQITGRLSGSEKIAATVIPIAMHIGLAGMLVSRAIKGRMKSKKNEPAGQLVDMWNDHFFHPRRLHVILARGNENLSGDVEGPAPDLREGRSRRSSSCSSSSSSSDDGTNSRHGRHAHRSSNPIAHIAEVRAERIDRIVERKERRREDRRGRREERRMRRAERRQTKHEKYRLVIVGL